MYDYKAYFEVGVLMMKFSGSYIEDEADQGFLTIVRSMKLDEKFAITKVIFDLKNVTSMTLANTDRSRVSHWEAELCSIYNRPGKDPVAYLATIEIYCILPDDSVVKDIYLERIAKLSSGQRITPVGGKYFNDLPDLLEHLDLLDLPPLLADG